MALLPFDEPPIVDTLEEERQRLLIDRAKPKGTTCKACGKRVLLKPFSIHKSLARGLRVCWADAGFKFFHTRELLEAAARRRADWSKESSTCANTDWSKLRYWSLIEQGKGEGIWRITRLGVEYIYGRLKIPKQAVLYNRKCLGFIDRANLVTIDDVTGFDSSEPLSGIPPWADIEWPEGLE